MKHFFPRADFTVDGWVGILPVQVTLVAEPVLVYPVLQTHFTALLFGS